MAFRHTRMCESVDIYYDAVEKFKTTNVRVLFITPLNRRTASMNTLSSMVLRRGTKRYPTLLQLTSALEDLYGATLETSTMKFGETHILSADIEFVCPKYLPEGERVLAQCINMLSEVVFEPCTEGDGFCREYFEQEKSNLRELIRSQVNQKTQYAVTRCIEEMCREEPFGVGKYGQEEDLEDADAVSLMKHFSEVISQSPVYIFAVGDMGDAEQPLIEKFSRLCTGTRQKIPPVVSRDAPAEVRHIREYMPVSQARVVIGYRTNIRRADPRYAALILFDGLLGAFPHSKLFQNVREREGLAYYVFSKLEPIKGVLVASAGVDETNLDRTVELMSIETDNIRRGRFSEDELEFTKKAVENRLLSALDSHPGRILSQLEGIVSGKPEQPEELLLAVRKANRDDLIEAANLVAIDTIYTLSGRS
ncbi:MAG: EF-P 5-aminopentanol modification-associated protein YfmF [Bacillota bacterium]